MKESVTKREMNKAKCSKKFGTKELVLVAMLGAISAILMLLEFPMPLIPPFIKMDFSELPIILGGFILGPVAGILIIAIKILLNFVLNGTVTMGIGELANFLLSVSYMVPAVLMYRMKKSKKMAALSMGIGTVFASLVAVAMNYFVMFPVYAKAFGMPLQTIVDMGAATNPVVNNMFTLMLFSILPFNLFKYAVVSVITFFVYKRVRNLLEGNKEKGI